MNTALFIRSEYSLLSSLCPIDKLVVHAKNAGYENIAITDYKVLAGASHFKKACLKAGLKPLFGMELEVEIENNIYPLVLLAKNDEAYRLLMHLASKISIEDKTIPYQELADYSKECFIILESDNMYATSAFLKKENALTSLLQMLNFFSGEVVIGLFDNDKAFNRNLNNYIKVACLENNIKTVAVLRTLYLKPEDSEAYHVLKAIKEKTYYDDPNLIIEDNRYLYHPDELANLYSEDDLNNADKIALECNVTLAYKTTLPTYQNTLHVDSKDYLINLCREGLKRRLKGHKNELYEKRLHHELQIILKMHFENYFLIVYDFILFAKKHNIMVGPGRGSAAGSLVSYCLGITDIDPIRYGLIFERFLNPNRVTMPDIDVDFPDDRRDEVINYCLNKYGKEHVGHIVTYGTLKAKQAIRDVGRVLRYPLVDINNLCKVIPNDPKMALTKAMEIEAFKIRVESDAKNRRLINLCKQLEGLPRHASTHAAGIVMSKERIMDIVPIFALEENIYTTQITMEHLEELGLIKMDFLGLRNLSILYEIIHDIKNIQKDFNINDIPLNDPKTFELIKNVNTLGVFQLESSGMQKLISQLQPSTFEEIALTIALFRPGPMENIPLFVENRKHPENIKYLHPALYDILKETYGIIVYQEQIMTIATKMAGFTMAKADILRKAMSKKKVEELNSLAKDFIDGCIDKGVKAELAKELYDLILKFANYGFNKSHSIAYAKIAYELAYLKANYPLYFYKSLLNGVIGAQSKTYEYLLECFKIKLPIHRVSLNYSLKEYYIYQNQIIMPLTIIKEVGSNVVSDIIEERNKNGLYKSYDDAIVRLTNIKVGSAIIENLIVSGAFDDFKLSRRTMKENLSKMINYALNSIGGQLQLNGFDMRPVLVNYKDNPLYMANEEKNVLGFYFSINPLWEIKKHYSIKCDNLASILNKDGRIQGFGQVYRFKEHRTKNGEWMAFVVIHDDTAQMDLVIMPNIYRQFQGQIKKNDYLYFVGNKEKEKSCLVKQIKIYKGDEHA